MVGHAAPTSTQTTEQHQSRGPELGKPWFIIWDKQHSNPPCSWAASQASFLPCPAEEPEQLSRLERRWRWQCQGAGRKGSWKYSARCLWGSGQGSGESWSCAGGLHSRAGTSHGAAKAAGISLQKGKSGRGGKLHCEPWPGQACCPDSDHIPAEAWGS